MIRLDGKVVLISGAARGIGGESAQLMAKAGAKMVIGDVLDDRGQQTGQTTQEREGAKGDHNGMVSTGGNGGNGDRVTANALRYLRGLL